MGTRTKKPARKSGWRQWTAGEAREVLAAWKRSGLPLATFARRRGLSAERVRWWRQRLGDWRGEGHAKLVPVVVTEAAPRDQAASSRPLHDELLAWSKAHQPHEPPASPMGAAIRYLLNHQVPLRRFLDDGRVPIDNGIVERLHVRTALTRKNFLFAGSDTGAERAAIAYTVLGCCELADVDPVEYLTDVLPRLARGVRLCDVPALLPARWKAARAATAASAAS